MNPSEGYQIKVALEYIKLGIRDNRVLMEGAITWVLTTTFAEAKARCQAHIKQLLEIYDTMESLTTLRKTCLFSLFRHLVLCCVFLLIFLLYSTNKTINVYWHKRFVNVITCWVCHFKLLPPSINISKNKRTSSLH